MLALFKEENRSDFGQITVNNRKSGSRKNRQDKNQVVCSFVNQEKEFRFYLQYKEKPLMITNRESSQALTHILKASLGLEDEEQTLERTSGRAVEKRSFQPSRQ